MPISKDRRRRLPTGVISNCLEELTLTLHSRQVRRTGAHIRLHPTKHAVAVGVEVVLRLGHILVVLVVPRLINDAVAHAVVTLISSVRCQPREHIVAILALGLRVRLRAQ